MSARPSGAIAIDGSNWSPAPGSAGTRTGWPKLAALSRDVAENTSIPWSAVCLAHTTTTRPSEPAAMLGRTLTGSPPSRPEGGSGAELSTVTGVEAQLGAAAGSPDGEQVV